jgi:hypothetical protein
VALTLIFAWTYRVLRWFGLGAADDEFAPTASWPPVERPASTPLERHLHESLGRALIVVGIAWFVAGMLAMHVFGVLPAIHSVPADIAFHGSGLWLASAGLALRFLYRPPLHRPKLGTAA